MGLALAFLPLAIAQPVSLAIFRVLWVLWPAHSVALEPTPLLLGPLPVQAAKPALPMQPKTLSAWLDPLSTVQRAPAMEATMAMASTAAPALRIRGVWGRSPLFVPNFLLLQL